MTDDISTDQAYVRELIARGELLTGLTADVQRENHRMQRFLGRLEGVLLVAAIAIGWVYFRIADDVDVLTLRLNNLEVAIHESR